MNGKIFIIEDEPSIIQLVQHNLEKNGFLVSSSLNGNDGLKELKKFQPDLFIIYEGWNDAKRGNLFPELLVEKQSIGFKNFVNYRTPFVIYEFFFSTIYTPPDLYDEKTIVKLVDNWRDRWKSVCESGNKENFSGCTVHYVNSKLDSGRIILQKKIKIKKKETPKSLSKRVLKEEHILYPKAIKKIYFNL